MVFIIIAVENGLTEIKNALSKKGHQVVDPVAYNYPIDALIYEGNTFQISHISRNNMPQMNAGKRPNYGVLLINSLGRSIDEIEEMLTLRCYSRLF